jgi:hypothetical protein
MHEAADAGEAALAGSGAGVCSLRRCRFCFLPKNIQSVQITTWINDAMGFGHLRPHPDVPVVTIEADLTCCFSQPGSKKYRAVKQRKVGHGYSF